MLILKIEKYLWPWERKRFSALAAYVEQSPHHYVSKIKKDVLAKMKGKYRIGEGGSHTVKAAKIGWPLFMKGQRALALKNKQYT